MPEVKFELVVDGAVVGAGQIDGLKVSLNELGGAAAGAAPKLKRAGDEIEDTGEKSSAAGDAVEILKGVFGATTAVVAGAGVAMAAAGAAFVAFSQEVERRQGIMRGFSGSVREVQDRTNGMVSSLEAMATANRLARQGIELTSNDLANFFVGAVNSAQERGEDLSQTIDQMAEALGGASADELRKFGIEVESGASRTQVLNSALDQLKARYGDAEASAQSFGGALTVITNLASDFADVFIEVVDATAVLGTEWDQLMEDFGLAELTIDRIRQTTENVAIALGATFVESIRTARGEITDFLQTVGRVMQLVQGGDFAEAVTAFREFGERSSLRRGDLGRRIEERAAEVGSGLAARRDARERRGGPRRIRASRESGGDGQTLDELMEGAQGGFGAFTDDLSNEATEGINALDEARKESEQLAADMHEREKERISEITERRKDAAEAEMELAREAFQRVKDDAEGVLGPVIAGISGALSSVIAGTQSADEAFQGLLASFLEMISQKAALEAAGQFASAVASFASQDYGGGALHLAAGVAWTAVAVAAGAASIAVAPPAAATPATPQANATPSAGGGDTVINLNGAIAFAGTRAELGREFGSAIEASDRRFGRAA